MNCKSSCPNYGTDCHNCPVQKMRDLEYLGTVIERGKDYVIIEILEGAKEK